MEEVKVDIDRIPSIPDEPVCNCFIKRVEYTRSCIANHLRHNLAWIVFILFILIAGGAVIGVLLMTKQTAVLPCSDYTTDTFATKVSIECIQYIWNTECSTKPFSIPAGYSGWWKQSPQGSTLVKCNGGLSGTQCGVGTYGNILVYMQFCNFYYGQ